MLAKEVDEDLCYISMNKNKSVENKKIWIKKSNSFKAARRFDMEYYLSMSPDERLETMQFLRETAFKLKSGLGYEKDRKGLRRVIKTIQ